MGQFLKILRGSKSCHASRGSYPGDPAAPVHGTTTPASPAPDKTRQLRIYESLASKQHLGVLHGDPQPPLLVPTTPPGTPSSETFPNIGPPALSDGTTFTPAERLSSKPILSPHGIPVPSPGATSPVQMRSVKNGYFQSQFSSCFLVQTPSSYHNGNYLPKCFFADFLPTMKGHYTPNLGPSGARPNNVTRPPISDFSENCDPLYAPPAQFWTT